MIPVNFKRRWEDRHADPSGNTVLQYPQGLTVEVAPERAAYLLAVGYADATDALDAYLTAAVDELKTVVALLRERNVEPTIDAVYMTYAEIVQAQKESGAPNAGQDAGQAGGQTDPAAPAATAGTAPDPAEAPADAPAELEIIPDSQEVPDVEAQPAPATRKR